MNRIALNVENEKHFSSQIEKFFSRYQIGSILKQCNAYKKQGVPVVQIVRYLFTLVFLGRSMFLDMQSEKSPNFRKDTVYRFKNADYISWMKFTTLLSSRIIRDDGSEFAKLSELESQGIKVYFTHPYSSWEKGTNECHNKLLRRFIPKGVSMAEYSGDDISYMADWANTLPRKTLGYRTPDELFEAELDRIYAR